jgi:hypothetical protein
MASATTTRDRNFRTRDPQCFGAHPRKVNAKTQPQHKPGIQQWKRKATAERHQSPSLASSTQKSSDAQAYFGTARSWLIEGEVSALAALVQPREFISFVSRPSYLDLLSLNVIDLKYV